ncbi:hypothetical protein Tco_0801542 [Tanacetum coccineum]|uniref:Uncharacterized protein n=1 Tax=Tanacetum coccineum TaxID=301880 RepID=A0ABQ4ZW93_9ASTR
MVVLELCPKHNMVAYLEKTDGNAKFHEIIDFLARSSIHNALTVSPVVSTTFVEQFWMSAKSKIINNVRYTTAKVAGKPVSISEASIRSDLLFYDANRIDSLPNQAIFDAIQLMGHLDAKKIFVMYPRFISMFLDKQLMNVPVPLDHFPVNALTSKVFSFMVKKGKHFSGKVTPLFASMLVQPTEDEGATSERPSEPQPTPFPPYPKSSGGNHGGHSSSDKSLSGNEGDMTLQSVYDLCISLCTEVIDQAKEIKHLKAQIKKLKKKAKPNAQDVGRTRDVVNEEKETADDKVSTKDALSTAKKSTDDRTEGRSATPTTPTTTPTMFGDDETIAQDERMARKIQEDREAEEDVKKLAEEEAIKTALSNEYDFIQARIEADRLLALRLQHEEREKFTIEERAKFLHDTIAAQRRFLAEQRVIAIRNRPPTRTQLRNKMMTYLKHVGNKKHSDLKNKTFEEIQALYEKVKRFDESFTVVGSTKDEKRIKEMNEGVKDPDQKSLKKRVIEETPKKEDTAKVPAKVDMTKQGTKKRKGGHMKMLARKTKRSQSDVDSDDEHRKCLKIITFKGTMNSEILERKFVIARLNKVISPDGDYLVIYIANGNFMSITLVELHYKNLKMGQLSNLVDKQYPLSNDLLQRMLDLELEVERESTAALDLIRFIKQQIDEN